MTHQVLGKPALQENKSNFSPSSPEEYSSWILGKPHSEKKGRVLELTLLKRPLVNKEIAFYQITQPDELFAALLSQKLPKAQEFSTTYKWYTYESANHFYVDFAHPSVFGGGFRGFGNVQEETLFCEFPTLPELAFATRDHPIHASKANDPTPFIIPNLKREVVLRDLYGQALEQIALDDITSRIEKLDPQKEPAVNIIGMAAIHWAGDENQYQAHDLKYLLKAAYLGFYGAKQLVPNATIHTAPWGCGVFLNSEKTLTVIQTLAAVMAEVDLVFEGLGNPSNPNYTTEFVEEAKKLVMGKSSAEEVLQAILEHQEKDRSWSPKMA
ncbi:MAG: hypothetical protein K1000chlam4_01068 [Chlamydiae bacterium]|nr:hypothetical protein [Chlamydiota bacterium]